MSLLPLCVFAAAHVMGFAARLTGAQAAHLASRHHERRDRPRRHRRVPEEPRVVRRGPIAAAPSTFRGRCVSTPTIQRLRVLQQQARRRQVLQPRVPDCARSVIEETESRSPLDTNGGGGRRCARRWASALREMMN